MLNTLSTFVASILLLIGLMSLVTPIPGGFILISFSLTVLICSSPTARKCIRYGRTSSGWFNKLFSFLERKVGVRIGFVGEALSKTRPGASEDNA